MALRTAFTELVGCEVPIQLAPMGGIATPALISAVNDAGGMGAVGTGPMSAEVLTAVLAEVHDATDGPLAVNLMAPFLTDDLVDAASDGATVVDFYFGKPDAGLVDRVHRKGVLAAWQTCSVREAEHAAGVGCDFVVVRGLEGGGRMDGSESLFPLLAEVVERVDIPVLAAGGIGDARGMAAALAAGAAGVRMGTRFLACEESGVHPRYRECVLDADAADSVVTDEFRTGWPVERTASRVLRSSLEAARAFDGDVVGALASGPTSVPMPRFGIAPPLARSSGSVDAMPMYAGESVRFVRRVEPAGAVVREISAEAERLLEARR